MGKLKFTQEFREEAVKQVIDRGYSVSDVARRLGVSAQSLYKWVKLCSPDEKQRFETEIKEVRKENLRLKAELQQAKEDRDPIKKGRGILRKKPQLKYAFILEHAKKYPIKRQCHLFGVSRSGYYEWLTRPESKSSVENRRLLTLIKHSYQASGKIYGSRRIWCDLREIGEKVSRNRVAKIMKVNNIKAQRGYKKPGYKYHKPAVAAPNRLQQQFTVDSPDAAWVTDITYIRTYEGWLYLAVVMDLFSRKIIGWSMKSTLAKEIVLDAILMAVWRRNPKQSVIIHSDQGSQYSSDEWLRFCDEHNLLPSMSRRGNCFDNAAVESFFSSLKKEKIRRYIFRTREEAKSNIFDYIEVFYNRARRHQHLGNISPERFEQQMIKQG
ncbi:MAG: IS3 family transposase [Kangiellaceae bacterium]|nr:IS3 family transposase [Kangiellaceae bacterium]